MAKVVFIKFAPNAPGSMYGIAKDDVDLASKGVNSSYKIVSITDEQYEDLRLGKKTVYYDDNNILVWNNNNLAYDSLEVLQQTVIDFQVPPFPHNPKSAGCIDEMKTKTFDNYTFPLSLQFGEIAVDKGIDWAADFEIF